MARLLHSNGYSSAQKFPKESRVHATDQKNNSLVRRCQSKTPIKSQIGWGFLYLILCSVLSIFPEIAQAGELSWLGPKLSFQGPAARQLSLNFISTGETTHVAQSFPTLLKPNLDRVRSNFDFLGSFKRGQETLELSTIKMMRRHGLHPLVEVRAIDSTTNRNRKLAGQSIDYRFFVEGIALCGFHARSHATSNKELMILGSMPLIDFNERGANLAEPRIDLVTALIEQRFVDQHVRYNGQSRCLQVTTEGYLHPILKVLATIDGEPFYLFVDDYSIRSIEPVGFDVSGLARVFPNNSKDNRLTDVALTNLVGNSTLTSEFLTVSAPDNFPKATSDNHRFIFEPSDPRYKQTAVFAYAQQHLRFFQGLGFEWYGPKPLRIRVDVKPRGFVNNALFVPADSGDGPLPTISIGNGDGDALQDLALDSDVVSHELGHHVLYKTLTSTSGESLVLHEGLADFFAFSRTNDDCLGESICPLGSRDCFVENQCLRTAESSLSYRDDFWNYLAGDANRLGHLHGQAVSGMLWDMRRNKAIGSNELTKLVFQASSHFVNNSGFSDLLLALLHADKELYNGKYNSAIRTAAEGRGFDLLLATWPQSNSIPKLTGQPLQNPIGSDQLSGDIPASSNNNQSSSKYQWLQCATIGRPLNQSTAWPLAVLLLVPFLAPIISPKLRPVTIRYQAKK